MTDEGSLVAPVVALVTTILGDAIVAALKRPDVVQAINVALVPPAPESSGLLTKSALAKTLGVSASTVDRLTREGMPIAAHVGDARRFDLEECRKWLAQRGKRPTRAPKKPEDDVDISDVIKAGGLREVER